MVVYGDVREEVLDITTISSIISQQQTHPSKRKLFYLRNTSPNAADIITISLAGNTPAVANRGVVLKQNDVYTEATSEGFQSWQGQINAICATANGKMTIVER